MEKPAEMLAFLYSEKGTHKECGIFHMNKIFMEVSYVGNVQKN